MGLQESSDEGTPLLPEFSVSSPSRPDLVKYRADWLMLECGFTDYYGFLVSRAVVQGGCPSMVS